MAHLSKGPQPDPAKQERQNSSKAIFGIGQTPNLLHPLIYFSRGLVLTTGGYYLLSTVSYLPTTRQSLKGDPRGPAIPNLLHLYLLPSRTDLARVKKTEHGHKTGRQGTDFDENL